MTLDEAIKHCEEVAGSCERGNPKKRSKSKCASEHRQLAEWLKELKRLKEQTRWIPVSERLPKKDGEYLLYGKIEDDEENYIFLGEYDACAEEFGIWQAQFDRYSLGCIGSEFYEYNSVIAWMPLRSEADTIHRRGHYHVAGKQREQTGIY